MLRIWSRFYGFNFVHPISFSLENHSLSISLSRVNLFKTCDSNWSDNHLKDHHLEWSSPKGSSPNDNTGEDPWHETFLNLSEDCPLLPLVLLGLSLPHGGNWCKIKARQRQSQEINIESDHFSNSLIHPCQKPVYVPLAFTSTFISFLFSFLVKKKTKPKES